MQKSPECGSTPGGTMASIASSRSSPSSTSAPARWSQGIAEAPDDAGPLEAVAAGLRCASDAMGPENRRLGPRLKAAVAASTELQERDALKSVGLSTAMRDALMARGVPETTAHLAGELGVLAFKRGYERWCAGERDDAEGFAPYALAALEELRAATATLV